MIRLLFFTFILLALLGDARIFLFIMNRVVFGDHRDEKSPWSPLLYIAPPLLLAFTLLFWPLSRWIDRLLSWRIFDRIESERFESIVWSIALAKVGLFWLIIAASVGLLWIVERIRVNALGEVPIAGVRSLPSSTVKLRKAHIPFASLRKLGAHNDLYDLEVTKHEIFIEELDEAFDGYRIAFLTDTHVASFVRRGYYRALHDEVRNFDPDLILLGGDFVSFERHIELMAEVICAELAARDGVYAVLGNHDYWSNAEHVRAAMEARGVRFLINRNTTLRRGTAKLPLVGIDEIYRGTPDVDAAFAGLDIAQPAIGVSHHPDVIDLLDVSGRRLDLLLCGHTHGGQIRFPFFGSVVVPSRHEGLYSAGFHRVRNVLMYVSRGIGAIPPLRILCPPELATFTLRRGRRT